MGSLTLATLHMRALGRRITCINRKRHQRVSDTLPLILIALMTNRPLGLKSLCVLLYVLASSTRPSTFEPSFGMLSVRLMQPNPRDLLALDDRSPFIMAVFRCSRRASVPALRYQGHTRPP